MLSRAGESFEAEMNELEALAADSNAQEQQDMHSHKQLREHRLNLRRLRTNFIRSKSKYLLLQTLVVPDSKLPDAAEIEKRVQEQQQAIKANQDNCTHLMQSIAMNNTQLNAKWVGVKSAHAKYQHDKENAENHSPAAQRQKDNASTFKYGKCDPSLLTLSNEAQCEEVSAMQLRAIEVLQEQLNGELDQISALELRDQSLKRELAQTQQEARGVEEALVTERRTSATLTNQIQWYRNSQAIVSELSGLSLQSDQEKRELAISCTTDISAKSQRTNEIKVRFSNDWQQIQDVELKPADVVIADIVQYGKQKQDLRFIVREVRARLTSHHRRVRMLQELNDKYMCQQGADKPSRITVTLRCGVIGVLRVRFDAPTTRFVDAVVESLQGSSVWDPRALEQVKAATNQEKNTSLVNLVQALEAKLEALTMI